jgi:lysophospholipase L1-like esterase
MPAITGAPAALLGLLFVQARRALRTPRLPPITYHVEGTVVPARCAGPQQVLELVALGDSAVAGVGSRTASGALPALVAEVVAGRLHVPVHVVGHGVSGARTAHLVSQVKKLSGQPDAVLVVIGTNDVMHLTGPWAFARATDRWIRALRARTATPVIVCSLPEIRAMTALPRPLRDVAVAYGFLIGRQLRRVADRHRDVTWVDVKALAGPIFLERPESMSADQFHPSPFGYRLMAEALGPAVVEACSGRSPAPAGSTRTARAPTAELRPYGPRLGQPSRTRFLRTNVGTLSR